MPTITLKDVPKQLHRDLKQQAERHHRSLNSEILACLERSVGATAINVEQMIQQARDLRQRVRGPLLTDAELRRMREAGRA